jgi:hypothetical protein
VKRGVVVAGGAVVVFGVFAFVAWRQVQTGSRDPELYETAKQELVDQFSGSSLLFSPYEKGWRVEWLDDGYRVHGRMKCDHPDLTTNTTQSPDGWLAFEVEMAVSGRTVWGPSYTLRRIGFR